MPTIISGTTGVSKVQDSVVTDGKLELTANSAGIKTALNASGSAPIYACRAWVNFNGDGTVAIRASGNVSSITDNGVGYYTTNFTTAMPDILYSCFTQTIESGTANELSHPRSSESWSTTSISVISNKSGIGVYDSSTMSVAIFR